MDHLQSLRPHLDISRGFKARVATTFSHFLRKNVPKSCIFEKLRNSLILTFTIEFSVSVYISKNVTIAKFPILGKIYIPKLSTKNFHKKFPKTKKFQKSEKSNNFLIFCNAIQLDILINVFLPSFKAIDPQILKKYMSGHL